MTRMLASLTIDRSDELRYWPKAGVYADRIYGDVAWWLRSSPFVPALLAPVSRAESD